MRRPVRSDIPAVDTASEANVKRPSRAWEALVRGAPGRPKWAAVRLTPGVAALCESRLRKKASLDDFGQGDDGGNGGLLDQSGSARCGANRFSLAGRMLCMGRAMKDTDLGGLLPLLVTSLLTGLAIGVVGSAFRGLLSLSNRARDLLIAEAHASRWQGYLAVVLTVGVCAMIVRWLVVRFAPLAAGSGVQHVEAVMRDGAPSAPAAVVPVKFVGGLLAIGAGLTLGREGPTVQMGAAIGRIARNLAMRHDPDRVIVDAAGAGAGLAVAFNAPIGGSIFVFEELTHTFKARQVLATLGAAGVAIAVFRYALGDLQEFRAGPPTDQPLVQLLPHAET